MRRDLAGRAALIAAGVGTALGAGAGLANAAPLEHDLQQDPAGNNAFDQSLPTDALAGGGMAQAPNLPLTGGLPTQTTAASPLDLASADQLAGLGGVLGGASGSSEQGGATEEGATDQASSGATDQASGASDQASGTSDQASGASDQATDSTQSASPSTSGSGSSEGSGSTSSPSSSGDDASGGYTTTYGAS